MSDGGAGNSSSLRHGAVQLPAIVVDTYNAELRDADGFIGDRASRRAFRALIEDWRERLRTLRVRTSRSFFGSPCLSLTVANPRPE